MNIREKTKKVFVGSVQIGGQNKIVIQSMTTFKTSDVKATIAQIKRLEKIGCQIVRVAILNEKDAMAIKEIKKQISIPLVADIHFQYWYALLAIEYGADKIRFNPGNIGSKENLKKVVNAAKEKNIPIRIGINSGSLPKDVSLTARSLVDAAHYNVGLLEELDFFNIIISLKTTNPLLAIETYTLAAKEIKYPLHLGITEAGTKFIGTIKSSGALGTIISKGIGDTIRISLTDEPEEEIRVAKELLNTFGLYDKPTLISCPTCGRIEYDLIPVAKEIEEFLESINKKVTIAIMGCIVNGPGEAKHADIAISGGKAGGVLSIKGKIVAKLSQDELIPRLKEEILKW